MHQHIRRIKTLLTLTFGNATEKPLASVLFFKQLVKFENKKNSIKELFLKNIGMLAYQITEHAGKTGEHYITSSKKESFPRIAASWFCAASIFSRSVL